MLTVKFLSGALQDFNESVDWYTGRSVSVARRFVMAVDAAIERAAENPGSSPCVDEQHQERALKRFPFRIIFRQLSGQILIVAIAHAKRQPQYWKHR